MPRPPASDDDAALRWDEFDDPSYSDPSLDGLAPTVNNEADGDEADGDEADGDEAGGAARAASGIEGDARADPASTPSTAGATLLTGVFAVIYLAYSVGWIIGIGLVPLSGPTVVIEIMYQFSEFLAIIASPLWFSAVVALTRDQAPSRGGRSAHRFGWLALGLLVLLPWPIVLGVLA